MSRFEISLPWKKTSQQACETNGSDYDQSPQAESTSEFLIGPNRLSSPQTFFVPVHYESNYRYPLVVWLHSDGFNENQVNHLMPHISTRNYVAVGVRGTRAADSIGHRFDWHESPAAIDVAHEKVMCAIEEARDRYSVHNERVVIAGYHKGGTMAIRLAMRQPNVFAAVASFGGSVPQGVGALANLNSLREQPLKMLWQVAEDSPTYDNSKLKSDIRIAQLIKAKVEIRQYKGDDEMNTTALADFNTWIMTRIVAQQPCQGQAWDTSPRSFSSN